MGQVEEKDGISLRMLVKNTAVGLAICIFFVVVLFLWLGNSEQNIGSDFVNNFGLLGLFSAVFFSDTVPTPGGAIPWITLCLQSQMTIEPIFFTCLAAYLLAGIIGFLFGRMIGLPKIIENFINNLLIT